MCSDFEKLLLSFSWDECKDGTSSPGPFSFRAAGEGESEASPQPLSRGEGL